MKEVLLVGGGGKVGAMITAMIAELPANSSGSYGRGHHYRVTVADRSEDALRKVRRDDCVDVLHLDVADREALARALAGKFAVLSTVPFPVARFVADGAAAAKVHYFDLTEDIETTRHVAELAKTAGSVMMPQCGLAPGFISIAAAHLAKGFEELEEVRLRVGALTEFPMQGLKYNLAWSTAGMVHQYLQGCEAIVDGQLRLVEPLEDYESFSLEGVDYEAFNTSGGLGTLCGRLPTRNLNLKTVRYPGYCEMLKSLIRDLRLGKRPELLVDILEQLPLTYQDVVLILVTAVGTIDGELRQESYVRKIYSRVDGGGRRWSAIQLTTAAAICAMLDLVREGHLPQAGFIHQDQVDFDRFLANRFGRHYA